MTDAPAPDRVPPEKLLARTSVKLRLAAASAVILVAGALIAPRAIDTGLSTPQERAAPLLEEQVQLREAPPPFRGVHDVAGSVRAHGVAVPPIRPQAVRSHRDFSSSATPRDAAGFGVIVAEGFVLTHAAALDGRVSPELAAADGRQLSAQLAAYDATTDLVLLQTDPAIGPPATLARSPLAPGALAVAVGHWQDADMALPLFVSSMRGDRYTLSAPDGAVPAGMPIYNLEGEVVAVAAGGGRGGVAFAVPDAARRLFAIASSGDATAAFGLALQDLNENLAPAFGAGGALVNDVVPAGPAGRAGIAPGDTLLAIGETEIASADEAARALASVLPGQSVALRLARARRVRTIEVAAATTYEVAALARAAAPGSAGPEAAAVIAASVLEAAGIPGDARIITLNGRAVTLAQAARELRTAPRAVLLLRHGGDQFFVALEPGR